MDTQKGYRVRVHQVRGNGSAWIVRTYRKGLICRRRVSSDWFLDRQQAETFAAQLRDELARGSALIKERKPGWTLRRPAQ